MASEEQINNQQRLNDLRQEELSYIQESEEFIASTISKSAQLADTIKSQLASVREKTTLDQKVLQFSKQNVDVLTKLKVDYQDIAKVDKDRKSILDQIQKNNNVINAQGKTLSNEVKEQAKAFVEQEKALTDQQKILSERINKQEQLEKIIKAQEAAGLKVDIADRALLKNAQESTRLQQMKVAGIQAEVLEAGRVADPLAVSLALLQDQNAQLDEAVGYLDEEEDAIRKVIKGQALFNFTLGAAEGLLKKLGLSSAAISLGLDEGKAAAEKLANELSKGGEESLGLFDKFRVLGAGIVGTFKGMAKGLKTTILALAIGKLFGKIIGGLASPVTGFIKDLKNQFTAGISFLRNQFFSLQSYIDDANAGEKFLQQLSADTAAIATNIGVSTKNARELVTQAGKVSASVGLLPEELAKTTSELQQAFGTTQKFSDDTVKTMGQLTNLFGLTNAEASEFVKLSQLSGQETSDTTLTLKTQIQALKERENIAVSEKEIMKEIAKSSASLQLTSRAQGKSLAEAAFHAKKLGLSLAQTEAIGSSLLQFESSIANEMEAELLIGRDLNLDKARQFALNKDIAGVAKEVANQIGSAAEFGEMNVLQQEALAKSIGVSVDELANMLRTQELLAGTGFDEMSDAQTAFNKLLKETGSEEKALAKLKAQGASDALADQIRSVNLQEKRRQEEREIAEAQGELAKQTLKLFSAFNKVFAAVKRLKAVVVDQMKPFFDEFGGLIGDGAGELEQRLVPAAEALGKFLNKMGLRLMNLVKGLDIDKIIQQVKDFAISVKDTFLEVKDKVIEIIKTIKDSPLGKFFSGAGGLGTLSIAPIAFKGLKGAGLFKRGNTRMAPMFVEDVSGGGALDKVLGKRNKGLLKGFKGLSKLAGGKKTVVGRALRGAAAMAGKRGSIGSQILGGGGKLGGIASKLGSVGKGLGKLAAGGGIGAIVGIAAEQTLGVFKRRAEAAAGALDEQIAMTDDATKSTELEAQRQKKLRAAQNLEIAGTTAKYAGLGATIGSVIPGVGTAVGAAVGAVVGFAVGLKNAAKERKYQASEEAKFQKNYRRLQIRAARDRETIQQNNLKLQLQAEKDAATAQLKVQKEFVAQLGDIDMSASLDGSNEAFNQLAQNMLDAGNITKDQFQQAIEGTITPLELMNAASEKAASNLKDLYSVVGQAADEQAKAAKDAALSAQGTNEAILEAEKSLIEGFKNNTQLLQSSSAALFEEFGDQLTDGINTYAAAALTGTDSDVGSGIADALREQLAEETGQSAEAINAALAGVASQLEKEGDFKLNSEEDLIKVQELVAERLLQGVDAQVLEGEKQANKAAKATQEFGLANTKTISELTKSGLETNMELQDAVRGLEGGSEALAAALAEGGDIQAFRTFLTGAAGSLAATDATAAQAIVDAIGTAETADDFILRPGQPALKFNKGDLIIGGTNLEGGNSEDASALKQELQEMKQMMSTFVEQVSQVINRPIVLEMNGNKVGQALGQDSYRIQ